MCIKFIDIGGSVWWQGMTSNSDLGIQSLSLLLEYKQKFELPVMVGNHIIENADDFENFLRSGDNPVNGNIDDPTSLAEEIISSLCDKRVTAIWLHSNPLFAKQHGARKIEKFYSGLFEELDTIEQDHRFKTFSQKPILGFCLMLPPMLFLGVRGLARPIHTEGFLSAVKTLKNDEIDILKKIFSRQISKQILSGIVPCNQSAIKLVDSVTRGTILGGLIDVVYNGIELALSLEKELGRKIISDKPLILFIEIIDLGQEVEVAQKLFNLVANKQIKIAAFCLADTLPNKKKSADEKQQYLQVIAESINQISHIADHNNIPICKGLKIGHMGNNYPLPMGLAEIKVINVLDNVVDIEVNYQQKSINKKIAYPFWDRQGTVIGEQDSDDQSWSPSCVLS